jgi:hypothetical protein
MSPKRASALITIGITGAILLLIALVSGISLRAGGARGGSWPVSPGVHEPPSDRGGRAGIGRWRTPGSVDPRPAGRRNVRPSSPVCRPLARCQRPTIQSDRVGPDPTDRSAPARAAQRHELRRMEPPLAIDRSAESPHRLAARDRLLGSKHGRSSCRRKSRRSPAGCGQFGKHVRASRGLGRTAGRLKQSLDTGTPR